MSYLLIVVVFNESGFPEDANAEKAAGSLTGERRAPRGNPQSLQRQLYLRPFSVGLVCLHVASTLLIKRKLRELPYLNFLGEVAL